MPSDPADSAIPSNDTGTVIFFRGKELIGAAIGYTIHDGPVALGKLKYGTYFAVQLPAGPHEFVVNSWRQHPFPLEIEAGKTYYMLGGVTTDAPNPILWTSTEAAFEDLRGSLKDVSVSAIVPAPLSQPAGSSVATCRAFGRLKVVSEDGRVYYPIAGSSAASDPSLVERFKPALSLLRLGRPSNDVWTDLKARGNGVVTASLAPGDYALTSFSPKRAGRTRVEAVALLRVPGTSANVYVGDLTIVISLENTAEFLEPQPYYVSRAEVTADPDAAQEAFEVKSGPLTAPPAVSLWCLEVGGDAFVGTLNHSVAIATLSEGCRRPDAATGTAP